MIDAAKLYGDRVGRTFTDPRSHIYIDDAKSYFASAKKKYDIIIDRISHEVPYYRAMLKRMALEGTYVINNPFWWSADDKFFNYSLGAKLGVAVPKTVLLPQHAYIKDITSESLRNLEFPIDWDGIIS